MIGDGWGIVDVKSMGGMANHNINSLRTGLDMAVIWDKYPENNVD